MNLGKLDAGEEVALRKFEKMMQSVAHSRIHSEIIRLHGNIIMVQGRKLFVNYWREAAGEGDGKVDDVDGLYVVVAWRKVEES